MVCYNILFRKLINYSFSIGNEYTNIYFTYYGVYMQDTCYLMKPEPFTNRQVYAMFAWSHSKESVYRIKTYTANNVVTTIGKEYHWYKTIKKWVHCY